MQIPIFGLGQVAKSPYVTAKALQNLYVEQRPQGEKSSLVAYGTPGLNLFSDFGASPCRGGIEFEQGSVAYVVNRGTLYEVNNAGIQTVRGVLGTTTGRVSMAHNGVQVMTVDGTSGYIYNTNTTAFVTVASALFANPTTVTYLGRRFICTFSGSSRYQWSDIDDGTVFGALNFANAETNPDQIVAAYASNGQLVLLGTETSEFAGNSGVADPAFIPLQGTANEWGLAARWSIAKYDNTFACLIKNRMGGVIVAKMNGYIPEPISNVDIASIINGYATTADATAYSYMLGQHPMYVISFPTAGKTWLFDGSTNEWTPLKSFSITRHVGEFSFNLAGRTVVSDYTNGRLYTLDGTALTDNGASIEREIVSENISTPDGEFLTADCFRLDMETGIGLTSGQGVNPQVALSISRDNGRTWGPDMWKTAGAIGEYRTRVEWRRLGTARVWNFKLKMTDPVPAVFVSACLNPDN